MNKIYFLLVAFASFSGASFASGPGPKKFEEDIPSKNSQKSEVFEHISKDDPDETQHFKMDIEAEKNSSNSEDEMDESSKKINLKSSEETNTPDQRDVSHDAERAASTVSSRYAPLMQFACNVRTALPHLLFSAAMTGFTVNELNDRDGPDVSIVPLSSMALLGGFHAIHVIRSGQNSAYNMVPNTVRDAVRTGLSFVPGLAYSTYHYLTHPHSPVISEGTKQCVRKCIERS